VAEEHRPRFAFPAVQLSILSRLHLTPQIVGDLQQGSPQGAIAGLRMEVWAWDLQDSGHAECRFRLALPLQAYPRRCDGGKVLELPDVRTDQAAPKVAGV